MKNLILSLFTTCIKRIKTKQQKQCFNTEEELKKVIADLVEEEEDDDGKLQPNSYVGYLYHEEYMELMEIAYLIPIHDVEVFLRYYEEYSYQYILCGLVYRDGSLFPAEDALRRMSEAKEYTFKEFKKRLIKTVNSKKEEVKKTKYLFND